MKYLMSILTFTVVLTLQFSIFAESEPLDPMLGIVTVGPVFGDFGGGGVSIGIAAGGSGHYFYADGYFQAGAQWEDGDFMSMVGGDAGYRAIFNTKIILRPHFFVAGGYGHMWENDFRWDDGYHYHVPYSRFGGGLLFGKGKRLNNGFELSFLTGYAIHVDAEQNPWDEDYSGFYFGFEIHYVLTF